VGLLVLLLSAMAFSPGVARAQPTPPTDAFSGPISVSFDFVFPDPEVVSYSPNSTTKLCFASGESLIGDEELFCYDGSSLRQVSQGLDEIDELTVYEQYSDAVAEVQEKLSGDTESFLAEVDIENTGSDDVAVTLEQVGWQQIIQDMAEGSSTQA